MSEFTGALVAIPVSRAKLLAGPPRTLALPQRGTTGRKGTGVPPVPEVTGLTPKHAKNSTPWCPADSTTRRSWFLSGEAPRSRGRGKRLRYTRDLLARGTIITGVTYRGMTYRGKLKPFRASAESVTMTEVPSTCLRLQVQQRLGALRLRHNRVRTKQQAGDRSSGQLRRFLQRGRCTAAISTTVSAVLPMSEGRTAGDFPSQNLLGCFETEQEVCFTSGVRSVSGCSGPAVSGGTARMLVSNDVCLQRLLL